jgi:predicted ATP-grasp superfamily ATP-dependent carboligase
MRIFIYECITGGGMGTNVPESLRREGRAMLDAIAADFEWLYDGVKYFEDEGSEPARFRGYAALCDWALVIAPEFDDLLATRAQWVIDAGARLLGPSPQAIRASADKFHLANSWQRFKVPHPSTILVSETDEISLSAPSVIKPRYGAGSQATFLVNQPTDWDRALHDARVEWPGGDLIVQRYISGQAVSVALLIGPKQAIALAPARQHLSSDGRYRYVGGSLPLPTSLAERAIELALQAVAGVNGLQGYVGVDLVLGDDGRDYAIEINPRLTTSYIGLRQLCEQNLAELMLRVVQGLPIDAPTWKAGEVQFEADGVIRMTSS